MYRDNVITYYRDFARPRVAHGEIILAPRKIKGIWFLWSRVQSRALICIRSDLHEIDGGESRQPRLVTRSTRRTAVSRRARNAAVDLIPRSRATHITGFLDPNRWSGRPLRSAATYYAWGTIAFTRGGVDAREGE